MYVFGSEIVQAHKLSPLFTFKNLWNNLHCTEFYSCIFRLYAYLCICKYGFFRMNQLSLKTLKLIKLVACRFKKIMTSHASLTFMPFIKPSLNDNKCLPYLCMHGLKNQWLCVLPFTVIMQMTESQLITISRWYS